MPGTRIHHPSLRNCVVTVPHPRKYKTPFQCPMCNEVHFSKTYHITLNNEGDAIVSPVILQRLKEINMAGMTIENEVANPPTLLLSQGGILSQQRIVPHEGKEGKWEQS